MIITCIHHNKWIFVVDISHYRYYYIPVAGYLLQCLNHILKKYTINGFIKAKILTVILEGSLLSIKVISMYKGTYVGTYVGINKRYH